MARRVFYSFHFRDDVRRASQVRQMNAFEAQEVIPSNDWESIKANGDAAVHRWINEQMRGKSAVVVLIGSATAGRKYIKYEIERAWNEKKGLLGVDINGLKDPATQATSSRGANPFSYLDLNGISFDSIVPRHSNPSTNSQTNYTHIRDNLPAWIEQAIEIRERYS